MAFQDDKDSIIALINTNQCTQAKYVNDNAADYEGLLEMLFEYASTFDCQPQYLDDILNVVDDAIRLSLGVYYNKAGAISNPKVIADGALTTVTINAGGAYEQLQIFNGAVIDELIIENNTQVDILVISGASKVTKLHVKNGSCVNALLVKACNDNDSTLDKVVEKSCIRNMKLDDNAIFNGYTCEISNV